VLSVCWLGVFIAPNHKKAIGEKLNFLLCRVVHQTPYPCQSAPAGYYGRLLVNHWLLSHGLVRKPEIVELCAPCIHDPNSRRIGLVRQVVLG
jgi:hypothetical protein